MCLLELVYRVYKPEYNVLAHFKQYYWPLRNFKRTFAKQFVCIANVIILCCFISIKISNIYIYFSISNIDFKIGSFLGKTPFMMMSSKI